MTDALETRCRRLLCELGLASEDDYIEVDPLKGGVASDIARVKAGEKSYCVKFALEKLKVSEDWRAPTHRNRTEFAWLEFARAVEPSSIPRLYGQSGIGFAMEHIASPDVRLWKDALMKETPRVGRAGRVAAVLGKIHRASARPDFCRARFENYDDFLALRIEPYLLFSALKHSDLSRQLTGIGNRLYRSRIALVHGDISPKNILFRGNCPILLDAECATIGDPAFDVAFCLNHLVLKSFHRPKFCGELIAVGTEFWTSYAANVDWEPLEELEARAAELLPALMLARVDGKSPVPYLSPRNQRLVRGTAKSLILERPPNLAEALAAIRQVGRHEDE
ncbi:MAG: aminoglycoside phosphotransferase family protein [Albidovulum sp.]|nr:aminoglycoside phosphotransferase family protein [Albidovulum sp.]